MDMTYLVQSGLVSYNVKETIETLNWKETRCEFNWYQSCCEMWYIYSLFTGLLGNVECNTTKEDITIQYIYHYKFVIAYLRMYKYHITHRPSS